MLLFDFRAIGNKLLAIRKRLGMTQAEVAEAAGLSDRTYADILKHQQENNTNHFSQPCHPD